MKPRQKISKAASEQTTRLTGMKVHEVSIVDRPANKRNFLIVKSDVTKDVPPAPGAPAAPSPGVQVSPEYKAEVVALINKAIEKIQDISKMVEAAQETPGAAPAPELAAAIKELGALFGGVPQAPPVAPPVAHPAAKAADGVEKAGKPISAARLQQLQSAHALLSELLEGVAPKEEDASGTATPEETPAAKSASVPAAVTPASAELADLKVAFGTVVEQMEKLAGVLVAQQKQVAEITKSRGQSRQGDDDAPLPIKKGDSDDDSAWPAFDMNARIAKRDTQPDKVFG